MDKSRKNWFGRLKETLEKQQVTVPPANAKEPSNYFIQYQAAKQRVGWQQIPQAMSGAAISGSYAGYDVLRPSAGKLVDSAIESLPSPKIEDEPLYQPYYAGIDAAIHKWLRTGEPTDWRDMLRLYEKLKASIEAGGSPTSELTAQAVVSKLKEKP